MLIMAPGAFGDGPNRKLGRGPRLAGPTLEFRLCLSGPLRDRKSKTFRTADLTRNTQTKTALVLPWCRGLSAMVRVGRPQQIAHLMSSLEIVSLPARVMSLIRMGFLMVALIEETLPSHLAKLITPLCLLDQ